MEPYRRYIATILHDAGPAEKLRRLANPPADGVPRVPVLLALECAGERRCLTDVRSRLWDETHFMVVPRSERTTRLNCTAFRLLSYAGVSVQSIADDRADYPNLAFKSLLDPAFLEVLFDGEKVNVFC